MIVLKRTDSPYFEEAFFVLRDGGEAVCTGENAMAMEAERIISRMNRTHENELRDRGEKSAVPGRVVWFLSGALCGIGAVFILRLLIH